jgi:hypothetical protein
MFPLLGDTVEDKAQTFLFDDYFDSESDRGIEVIIPFKGKALPFRIKRSLTIRERQRINEAAIQIDLDQQTGKPRLTRQDQGAFTTEALLVGLKFWPFEYKPGKPVPINHETIAKLDGALADELAARILGTVEVNKETLDPFEKKSDAA